MFYNEWGGPVQCRADGTNGPWVMINPERLLAPEFEQDAPGDGECVAIAQWTMEDAAYFVVARGRVGSWQYLYS